MSAICFLVSAYIEIAKGQKCLQGLYQTHVRSIIIGSHATVGAPRERFMFGSGKTSWIDCRRFLCSPHPLPLLLIFRTFRSFVPFSCRLCCKYYNNSVREGFCKALWCISQFQRCPSPPSLGNRGAFVDVVSPGSGALANFIAARELGISIPRGDPRVFDTRVFKRWMSFSGRTRPLSKTDLSVRD